jgi:hypothetical protein
MVEWTDPRVLVAIYAAIISTVSLTWNIINLIISKKRKIKVEFRHNVTFTQSAFGFSPVVATLSLKATNIGNENLHIKDTEINFCGKKIEMIGQMATAIACIDPRGAIKYPYPLQKGEVFKDDIGVRNIVDAISDKLKKNDKLRFIVRDTLNKKYKSSIFQYEALLNQLKIEEEYNRNKGHST